MKRLINVCLVVLLLTCCNDKDDFSHFKFYDYYVVNQLPYQVVKIVPLTKSEFWISSVDTIVILPSTKSVIGTSSLYDDNRKIVDRYEQNDIIDRFDVFIDSIRLVKNLTIRSFWTFSYGTVDESGIYTLYIDQNIISK